MTGLIGAFAEAWDELRAHRLRVALAVVGVAVAVFSITVVAAAGAMARQVSTEWNERWGGRPITLSATVQVVDAAAARSAGGTAPTRADYLAAFDHVTQRYSIRFASMHSEVIADAQFPTGTRPVTVYGVGTDYQIMHRLVLNQGRWFIPADADRLSPAIVVNQAFLDALRVPDLDTHPTVTMGGRVVATIIGTFPNTWPQDDPRAYALFGAQESWSTPAELARFVPTMEFWVPDSMAGALRTLIASDLRSDLPGTQASVYRLDTPVDDVVDGAIRWVILGITVAALVLGALGLVNIGLVSVRARMREIGMHRALGATSGRIFASVLLESVVATTLAGILGVAIAIITLRYVPLDQLMGQPVETQPNFPWLAAAAGLAVAVAVGALTGLIPAVVAVRIRVIDAIRT